MKKLLIGCIGLLSAALFAGCERESHDGTYVASWKNEFSLADDTIIIKKDIVTKRTGYRKIRNGQLKPKEWSVERWIFNDPNSPIIELGDRQIAIGSTIYKQINK
ncbi:hypothetical protein PQ469_14280 [Mucilaginibacter sp. KACC 22773]|uniref:hypothetical protein n=1 Tax=Mucilaginibacter sp. KACC 22773 TaxID=3025671 RepID=UPI0023665594|nr:hypothetical protein [Mucilaginibacter sp. KACC 22773]WDF81175.1 hypothetical protein PQ469_14280 [Mucilaginibacter sp. KACC 22773]